MKHFTKHIKYLDTHTTAKNQGYNGAIAPKMEATLDAATSTLHDKQLQMENLAR